MPHRNNEEIQRIIRDFTLMAKGVTVDVTKYTVTQLVRASASIAGMAGAGLREAGRLIEAEIAQRESNTESAKWWMVLLVTIFLAVAGMAWGLWIK